MKILHSFLTFVLFMAMMSCFSPDAVNAQREGGINSWTHKLFFGSRYGVNPNEETCRNDVFVGKTLPGERCDDRTDDCGWDGDVCTVIEMSAECDGTGFGDCCTQTMRIDAAAVIRPPFVTDIDPATCYPVAIEAACSSQSDNSMARTLAAGKICVFETRTVVKAFGPAVLTDPNGTERAGPSTLTGFFDVDSEDGRHYFREIIVFSENL